VKTFGKVLAVLVFACVVLPAHAQVFGKSPIVPEAHIADPSHMVSTTTFITIDRQLATFYKSGYGEVYVRLEDSLKGVPIQSYTHALLTKLASSSERVAVLVIAKKDRQARIEVSDALSSAVTDVIASKLLEDNLLPAFGRGDVDAGVSDTVTALTDLIVDRKNVVAGSRSALSVRGGDIAFSLISTGALASFFFCFVLVFVIRVVTEKKYRKYDILCTAGLGLLFSLLGGFGSVIGGVVFATPILVVCLLIFDKYTQPRVTPHR
jgi:uncharacterized membrane protein YgcG